MFYLEYDFETLQETRFSSMGIIKGLYFRIEKITLAGITGIVEPACGYLA